MKRWKERFWPTVDSPLSARQAVERAARISSIWAFLNIALGLVLIFSGTKVTDSRQGQTLSGIAFLVPGILYGLIAWRIRCMSRGWTLGGLCLAAFILLADLASATSPLALIACAVVLLYFINASRAVIPYERLVEEELRKESLGTL